MIPLYIAFNVQWEKKMWLIAQLARFILKNFICSTIVLIVIVTNFPIFVVHTQISKEKIVVGIQEKSCSEVNLYFSNSLDYILPLSVLIRRTWPDLQITETSPNRENGPNIYVFIFCDLGPLYPGIDCR